MLEVGTLTHQCDRDVETDERREAATVKPPEEAVFSFLQYEGAEQ